MLLLVVGGCGEVALDQVRCWGGLWVAAGQTTQPAHPGVIARAYIPPHAGKAGDIVVGFSASISR